MNNLITGKSSEGKSICFLFCFCAVKGAELIKDTVWSAYYEDPVRFADVINGLVAAGKLLVEANDFAEKDSKSIPPKMDESGGKKSNYAWSGAMQRDAVRKFAKGVYYSILFSQITKSM